MRTISLWQPWASLIALRAKQVETRHWSPPAALLGQRIGIHAAKTKAHLGMCSIEPFDRYVPNPGLLPLGAVVATAVLGRASQMTAEGILELQRRNPHEAAFGLYEPGRYAWVLRDIQQLAEPVPFRGSQGFFDVPDELLGHRPAQGALL